LVPFHSKTPFAVPPSVTLAGYRPFFLFGGGRPPWRRVEIAPFPLVPPPFFFFSRSFPPFFFFCSVCLRKLKWGFFFLFQKRSGLQTGEACGSPAELQVIVFSCRFRVLELFFRSKPVPFNGLGPRAPLKGNSPGEVNLSAFSSPSHFVPTLRGFPPGVRAFGFSPLRSSPFFKRLLRCALDGTGDLLPLCSAPRSCFSFSQKQLFPPTTVVQLPPFF